MPLEEVIGWQAFASKVCAHVGFPEATCEKVCSGNRLCSRLQGRFRRNRRSQVFPTAAYHSVCPYRPGLPGPIGFSTAAAESAYRQYRVVRWFLLPEGELRRLGQSSTGQRQIKSNRQPYCKSTEHTCRKSIFIYELRAGSQYGISAEEASRPRL